LLNRLRELQLQHRRGDLSGTAVSHRETLAAEQFRVLTEHTPRKGRIDAMRTVASLINGRLNSDNPVHEVCSPFAGEAVTRVHPGDATILQAALTQAFAARKSVAGLPPYRRAEILEKFADLVAADRESLAVTLRDEAGKPITLARIEADRTVETIRDAARCTRQMRDEFLPLDGTSVGAGRHGILKRFPLGLIAAITPFNFPLNLVAHKIAPAIAAGCPVVLKPASQTPSPAVRLAELAIAAGWPPEALQIVLLSGAAAGALATDERPAMITFTGSPEVGWELKSKSGHKKVALELGGNASAIIEPDADWQSAADRLAICGFGYAGQSCIAVQRVYVHEDIATEFIPALVAAARAIACGDPSDETVMCGPLIDKANADRVESWIAGAVQRGAEVLSGNTRTGNVIAPTVVTGAGEDDSLNCNEVFGPVVTVATYRDFEEVLQRVNASRYGLQAGIYTNDWGRIWKAYETLEVGGVIHNDAPTYRADPMPYGGIKHSGMGREGARFAIEEMTEPRLLVLKTPAD
jgi:acyl-CoA reductase-like NAD-dependent aldehyde dehydrogenase